MLGFSFAPVERLRKWARYVNTDDDTTVLFYSIYEQHASL